MDLVPSPSSALASLSEADRNTLAAARQQNSRPQAVSYDSIKLKDSEKEVLDVDGNALPRGEWYIESYDSAKREKSYRCIGANPEIVILHRCYTYSWYKDGEGLMAWTSDIQDLSEYGHVTLFAKKDGKVSIEFQGRYKPDFKAYMDKNYVVADPKTGKPSKLLQFQNLLYVFFEGNVYRLFVSNASAAGIAEGEKAPDFKNAQDGSLIKFIETTRGAEMDGALCEWVCKLGAVFRKEMTQPFYIRTFENAGPNAKLSECLAELRKLSAVIEKDNRDRVETLGIQQLADETKVVLEVSPFATEIEYKPSVDVESLPF